MDELEISGRRYISSARAAKEHKYHSDYIGQLVRGGKVVGQKVGRAWYVDADSLAEYLGKEVPLRGPMTNKQKSDRDAMGSEDRPLTSISGSATDLSSEPSQVPSLVEGSFGRSVAEHDASSEETESEVRDLPKDAYRTHEETSFIMPLRKNGRSHVIASIDDNQSPAAIPVVAIETQQEAMPEVAEEVEPEIKKAEPTYVADTVDVNNNEEEEIDEEETFIPVKITNQSTRNIYAEPEDSFYKVSRKGLRYVSPSSPAAQKVFAEGKHEAAPRIKENTDTSARASMVAKSLSVVLVAGILSLGIGVLLSYYLHATTTVIDAGQTSSVILSN